jgi:hypothetical protein
LNSVANENAKRIRVEGERKKTRNIEKRKRLKLNMMEMITEVQIVK